jgi:hypothetical protein
MHHTEVDAVKREMGIGLDGQSTTDTGATRPHERLTHTPRQRHACGFLVRGQVTEILVAISACRCGVLHVPRHGAPVKTGKVY